MKTPRWLAIVLLALLLGGLAGFLLARRSVPPPAFTGASFGNSAPNRKLKSAVVHYWLEKGKVPEGDAARRDWQKWEGNTAVPLVASPKGAQYAAADSAITAPDIVMMALVVIVDQDGKEETYINFLSDHPSGIHHLNAWLTDEKTPALVVDYFYGEDKDYYPSKKGTDAEFYGP